MKQLKMTCYFDGDGCDRCFVVSISHVPASVVCCKLGFESNGLEVKDWLRPVRQRKAELRANLGVCRDYGLFVVADWTLVAYKLEEELITFEDITNELVKRCSQLCRGRKLLVLPLYTAPSPTILEHNKADLEKLLSKARCITSFHDAPFDFRPCRWLYRHKPVEYFEEIFKCHDGIMQVYIKDNNGDPASCINGRLNGLFFSADVNPKKGKPKWRPIYGNRRLRISCLKLFEFASNLYFADVYCNTSDVHHVTLVMTNPGSPADRFCEEKLLLLCKTDRQQNPFLYFKDNKAYVSTKLMVEVFYTEDIDIVRCLQDKECDASLDKCPVKSYTKRHLGRIKNPNCRECNL